MVVEILKAAAEVLATAIIAAMLVFLPYFLESTPQGRQRYLGHLRRHRRIGNRSVAFTFGFFAAIAGVYNVLASHNYITALLSGLAAVALFALFRRLPRA